MLEAQRRFLVPPEQCALTSLLKPANLGAKRSRSENKSILEETRAHAPTGIL
jgi:hypothetical protein